MSLPETRPIVISSLSKVRSLGSPFFSVSVSLIMEPREGVQPQKRRLATLFSTIPRVKNRQRPRCRLPTQQRQKRRRENRQNSTRGQRRDSAGDHQRNPISLRGRRRGFVLGPSRH